MMMIKVEYRFNNGAPVFDREEQYQGWSKELDLVEMRREEDSCFTYIICMNKNGRITKSPCFIRKEQASTILKK
jgi:hypothetical protein